MKAENLDSIVDREITADLVIVGGGPAAVTIAREVYGTNIRIIIAESGVLREKAPFIALNKVELDPASDERLSQDIRASAHKSMVPSWEPEQQPYGVRCRTLGGASHLWAGKSAPFDDIDFECRPWIPHSGWPVSGTELSPFIQRAAEHLNLGPTISDDRIWDFFGKSQPGPSLDPAMLRSFFWQFSRSRSNVLEAMRFGADFLEESADNVRLLINATAVEIITTIDGAFEAVELASISGKRVRARGKIVVLAAGGIENPRLLLVSNGRGGNGLGNSHDAVGRFLLDHPSVTVGHIEEKDARRAVQRFGFRGFPHRNRMQMYMHGLALTESVQREKNLANCAIFMLEEHAQNDPVLAFKRLASRQSSDILGDLLIISSSPGTLSKSVVMKLIQSGKIPYSYAQKLIDLVIRINPNFATREHLNRGVQYKVKNVRIEAIGEQTPDPSNRVCLGGALDMFGVPIPRIVWRVDDLALRSMAFLARAAKDEFARTGIAELTLSPWVEADRLDQAPIKDMAHMMGATRMSDTPEEGVVDLQCRVHGADGVYVAGASVFPTGGHANPTLMILALAIRLAEHLKAKLKSAAAAPSIPGEPGRTEALLVGTVGKV